LKTYSITKDIIINVKPEKVFDALTTSDEIVKYYPLKRVVSNWVIGDTVNYSGEVNEQPFTDYGVITELVRPIIYAYSYWSDNHGTEKTPDNHLNINYSLSLVNGVTQLTLTQDNIKSEEMFNLMNNIVWGMLLNSLKEHMESGIG
jgi:uncharacterized protein YndB with AHSA1/START domain